MIRRLLLLLDVCVKNVHGGNVLFSDMRSYEYDTAKHLQVYYR